MKTTGKCGCLHPDCCGITSFIFSVLIYIYICAPIKIFVLQIIVSLSSENLHHQSYSCLLKAENYVVKDLFIEKSKLLWHQNEKDSAISLLKRNLKTFLPREYNSQKEYEENVAVTDKKIYAKVM